jgi:hypothetical protein
MENLFRRPENVIPYLSVSRFHAMRDKLPILRLENIAALNNRVVDYAKNGVSLDIRNNYYESGRAPGCPFRNIELTTCFPIAFP